MKNFRLKIISVFQPQVIWKPQGFWKPLFEISLCSIYQKSEESRRTIFSSILPPRKRKHIFTIITFGNGKMLPCLWEYQGFPPVKPDTIWLHKPETFLILHVLETSVTHTDVHRTAQVALSRETRLETTGGGTAVRCRPQTQAGLLSVVESCCVKYHFKFKFLVKHQENTGGRACWWGF